MTSKSNLIIVSNRLPVTVVTQDDGSYKINPSAGGLASGMQTMIDQKLCKWVGWPGKVTGLSEEKVKQVVDELKEKCLEPVFLSDEEVKGFYEDYSNGVLWPAFHSLVGELPLSFSGFDEYVKVNKKFAEVVAGLYQEGDTIWVHDYQFMMMPMFIRNLVPNALIGFFLHIPFPSQEIINIIPHNESLLRGVLASDLIGFHTTNYLQHFSNSVLRVLGRHTNIDSITFNFRKVKLGVFPMGIDSDKFESISADEDTIKLTEEYKGKDGCRMLLGIDRLDYTKGIPRRLMAFDALLEKYPEYRGKVRFVQVAVPSRMDVDAYKDYKKKVEAVVANIQGKYSTPNWSPIHYMFRSFSVKEVIALYKAADIMLVTPVNDGMNLVAKEFIASRIDNRGVLVLSEFAGASTQLSECILINPYNNNKTAESLNEALKMSNEQQEEYMKSLRENVKNKDIHYWIESFLSSLKKLKNEPINIDFSSVETLLNVIQKKKNKLNSNGFSPKLVLFLDYDGTLTNFKTNPEDCAPTEHLTNLLLKLTNIENVDVNVVSGRPRETLGKWFESIPITLHCEHGAYSKTHGSNKWEPNFNLQEVKDNVASWKQTIQDLFNDFTNNVPGTFVEDKGLSLAWHYRGAGTEFCESRVNELKLRLLLSSNAPFSVLYGNKVIEVGPSGINKGNAIKKVVDSCGTWSDKIWIAIGDDVTDEAMFSSLPKNGISIHVGGNFLSQAKYNIECVEKVHELLDKICELF